MSRRVVVAILGIWVVLIAGATGLVALREERQPSSASRTLKADADAQGLMVLDLRAADGWVEVTGVDDDRVGITVEISIPQRAMRWFETQNADLARAELIADRQGDGFAARVRVPGNAPIVERWTVRVPRRFKVDLDADDGAIEIAGVSGGVRVRAKAGVGSRPGSIRVIVPGGPLDLSLGVGDVYAETSSLARGPIDVKAGVGDARVTIAGREIVSARAPGPGHRLRVTGAGPDAVTLRVGVGSASLDIK